MTDLLQMLETEDVVDQSAALEALGVLGAPIGSFPLGATPEQRAAAKASLEAWCAQNLGATLPAPAERADEARSNVK
ncbi:MAG: hypothetical protein JNL94_19710 [Planctomycetes bacterium]|nr:hypothetical protein [Planctomycetota bacterium]